MRSFAYSALVAASLCAAAPALAQPTADAPFTGLRVEGILGGDRVQANGGHEDGFLYGIGVGYDVQMRGLLVGVEGEASRATTDQCERNVFLAADRACVKAGRDLYAGARVGTLLGARTLVYAKAGYTNARIRETYDDGTSAGLADYRDHVNLDGLRVGGGVEHALGTNSFVKAEYRYSNYERGIDRHQVVGGFGVRF